MKLTRALSASVLVGAVVFAATACSAPKDGSNESPSPQVSASSTVTPSATATPSEIPSEATSESPETEAPTETPAELEETSNSSVEEIASTVSGYYDFVATPGSLDAVKGAGLTADTTDAELKEIAASFEGLQYFDTSSSENIRNAINQLYARTTQSERKPGATVAVPVDAVEINGDTATVKASAIEVTVNGTTASATESPYFEHDKLNLVKKADGSWVMIAEPARQAIP